MRSFPGDSITIITKKAFLRDGGHRTHTCTQDVVTQVFFFPVAHAHDEAILEQMLCLSASPGLPRRLIRLSNNRKIDCRPIVGPKVFFSLYFLLHSQYNSFFVFFFLYTRRFLYSFFTPPPPVCHHDQFDLLLSSCVQ